MIIKKVEVDGFPNLPQQYILDFDVTDSAKEDTAFFEHAGRKISPVYVVVPKDNEEKHSLNALMYFVSLLPFVTSSYIEESLSSITSEDKPVKMSIEFFRDDEDPTLYKYFCTFTKQGFWKQTLVRKDIESEGSKWIEEASSDNISDATSIVLPDKLMTNVRMFDAGLRIHKDPNQRNVFEAKEEIEKTFHNAILSQIADLIKRRPYATITETPKDVLINMLRYTSFKEGHTNHFVSDVDVDSDGFIRFYSARAERGNRLLSYTEERIKHFLVVASVALTMHVGNGVLFIDKIDAALIVPRIRMILSAVCDPDTNKSKSQLIASVSDPSVVEAISKNLKFKPKLLGRPAFSL